jgi:hypothetical protein
LPNEVSEHWCRATGIEEEHLTQISRRQSIQEDLEHSGWLRRVGEISWCKSLDYHVAEPAR